MSRATSASDALWAMTAFGMCVASDMALPGTALRPEDGREPDLLLYSVPREELEGLADSPRCMRYLHSFEGCGYAMLEGKEGDVLFHYRDRALFHLSSDGRVLRCAVSESGTAWQRVLLDTVFWAVSLLQGFELLHAGAVVTSRGLIALVGPSGAGKTTLAIELLRRGGELFADDIVALQARGDEAVAYPAPALMNVPRSVAPWDPAAWEVLAQFGEEDWVWIHRAPPPPQPIRAMVLLTPGAAAQCVSVPPSNVQVLPHMVTFIHLLDDRRRQQFEVAGGLAAGASLVSLSRPPRADPAHLADLILECLDADLATRVDA
jgi:hypothetical protein